MDQAVRNIYIYTNTCMHTIIFSGKRGHEFEGEWGVVYGITWRKERESTNVIIISKIKNNFKRKN